jgi:microcystin-dependent protein
MTSFTFPPKGWAWCNGQALPINQNQALFSLLGTMYGGNGTNSFNLPNLQGRVPLHFGNGYPQGQSGGEQSHTLTLAELPAHIHTANGSSNPAATNAPSGALLATANGNDYAPPSAGQLSTLNSSTLQSAGSNQPHTNMQPYLTLNFCIALSGIFPSRS